LGAASRGALVAALAAVTAGAAGGGSGSGAHLGEREGLDVRIEFSNAFGSTVTDGSGTRYYVWGMSFFEPKIYPPKYWGSYPLYFFDTVVGVKVRVTNRGPRAIAKVRVRSEAWVLHTDGSDGEQLAEPREFELAVPRGVTRVADASFLVPYSPDVESGLDRLRVKVFHPNQGSDGPNASAGLIASYEGVFCPPEFRPEAP